MAKRFTDSEKWKKPFIRAMKAPYKLLWIYILDECDHAGIWQVDFDVAQIKIGEKLNKETALKQLEGKIFPFDSGEKWFIPDFIDFQYGTLNEKNRVHESVLSILAKYNLLDILETKNKPLASPLEGAKDKDKDMDKDMEQDKDTDKDLRKKMRDKFSEIYLKGKKIGFVWDAKSATHLKALVPRIRDMCEVDKSDESVIAFWATLLENLPDWYFQNGFSPAVINSKFNEIVTKIHKPNATNTSNLDRQVAEILKRGNPYA